jgi:hypothetical protein
MILDNIKVKAKTEGMLRISAVTVNLDGQMFEDMMGSRYANKIAAPIRELSTNARDAHVDNGNPERQFEVQLPTAFVREFSVRDFGISMTDDEVVHLFGVLGLSSKRESNEVTGALGLGSKSPFAYCSAFTVTCWKDGEERVYSVFKDDGGFPHIALASQQPSDKEQGMKVSFAVEADDINKFHDECNAQLKNFTPLPIVTPSSFSFTFKEAILEGDGWTVYQDGEGYYDKTQAWAVQGSVTYPIDRDVSALDTVLAKRDGVDTGRYYYGDTTKQKILKKNILLHFDIGDLDVTTSREGLQYTAKTIENISKRLGEVEISALTNMQAELDAFPRYRDAFDHWIKLSGSRYSSLQQAAGKESKKANFLAIIKDACTYKGRKFIDKITFEPEEDAFYNDIPKNARSIPVGGYRTSMTRKTLTDNYKQEWIGHAKFHILIEHEGLDSRTARLRGFWKDGTFSDGFLWVLVQTDKQAKEFIKKYELDAKDYTTLKDTAPLKMPTTKRIGVDGKPTKEAQATRLRIAQQCGYYEYKNYAVTEDVELDDAVEYVYIDQPGNETGGYHNNTYLIHGSHLSFSDAARKLQSISNTFLKLPTIYSLGTSKKKLKAKSNWLSVSQYIKREMEKLTIKELAANVSINDEREHTVCRYLKGIEKGANSVDLPKEYKQRLATHKKAEETESPDKYREYEIIDFLNYNGYKSIDKLKEAINKRKTNGTSSYLLYALARSYQYNTECDESLDAFKELIKLSKETT